MNDKNLVNGKFTYKAAWQGAKQLCSGVRAKFFCVFFLFVVCSLMVLLVLSFFFPQHQVTPSFHIAGAVLPGLVQTSLNSFILAYFTLYIYKLFLARNKPQQPQYCYKISLKDGVVASLMFVCAHVISFIMIFMTIMMLMSFIPTSVPHLVVMTVAPGILIPAIIFMFIIVIVLSGLLHLMLVRRVDTGESWLNVLKFSIKRALRYSWRLIVLVLFSTLIFALFALVGFAIQFVGAILLHDLLLSGGLVAHIIVVLAHIVAISAALFMFLRYFPIVVALPCSIYLCSYTADGVQPVSDEGGKDDAKLKKSDLT